MLSYLHIPICLIRDVKSTDDALILSYIYASTASKYNNPQEHIGGYAWCWDPQHIIASTVGLSVSTLKRCVNRLKDNGMIVVERLNTDALDHTNYYRLTDKSLVYFLTQKELIDKLKMNSSMSSKRADDYMYTNTHTNTHTINNNKYIDQNNKFSDLEASNESNLQNDIAVGSVNKRRVERTSDAIDEIFDKFWTLYPRKVVKSEAYKLFCKLKISDAQKIVDDMSSGRIKFSEDTKFIPHPTTFLRQKRYLDVSDAPTKQQVYEFAANFRNDTNWARKVAEEYCKSNTTKDYKDYVKSYFYISKF